MPSAQCRKAYVAVNLDVDEEGNLYPRAIRWRDGRGFLIERLTYKCRAASYKVGGEGGMLMILSYRQIEEIAVAVINDFWEFFFGSVHTRSIQATPIDQFAREYLGLEISFARLSDDGSICGLTSYANTEYVVQDHGITRTIPLKPNQVLLDTSFIQPGQVKTLYGKRRFTIAHECAHQILYQMESDEMKVSFKKQYAERTAYSLRDLKTREDWNEWQANVLGAAILMPQAQIDLAMWYFSQSRVLTNYEGRFSYSDRSCLTHICHAFGVSKTAAIIRLRQLGYVEDCPYLEYHDPLEVWHE